MTKQDDTAEPRRAQQDTTIPQLLDEAGAVLDKAKRKRTRRKTS